ncbi:MAG: glycerophosphodiester phosphodiesterase [Oscillospiraceae bacterium]|nr:glycerophosphodiester phosphodiesterase [Oscillospiraceae bacterium]
MVWIILIVCAVIFTPLAIIIVCTAPGIVPREAALAATKFYGLHCAHRGLHSEDQRIPENSLAAFAAARDRGYGVELDIRLTKDEQVIVFHDDDFARVCSVNKSVGDLEYSELSEMRLFGTGEKIPTLTEALNVLKDTPVIVELKYPGVRYAALCKKAAEILKSYGGHWCVESFDPRIMAWFKKNEPKVLRGQLSNPVRNDETPKLITVLLGNLMGNIISRPHFIAYSNEPYPLIVKLCMIMKPIKAVWTVKSADELEKCQKENDIIIFENFKPSARFTPNRR